MVKTLLSTNNKLFFFFEVLCILQTLFGWKKEEQQKFWFQLIQKKDNNAENQITDDTHLLLNQPAEKEIVFENLKPIVIELLKTVNGKNDYDFLEPHILQIYEILDEIGVGTYGTCVSI